MKTKTKTKKAKRTKVRRAPDLFDYQDNLRRVLRDLQSIRELIPAESSRHGCLMNGDKAEAAAIIEFRKTELLKYIQVICEDHLFWGKRLLKRALP